MQNSSKNQKKYDSEPEFDWELFGRNVRKYRKRKKLTQEQLAELCGMQPNSISRIEKGSAGTKMSVLKSLSNALEVSPDALLQGNFDAKNSRYAEHFYGLRDELIDQITDTIQSFFDAEAKRQDVDSYESRHRNKERILDPAVEYHTLNEPTADPNLPEKTDRRRKPYDRK